MSDSFGEVGIRRLTPVQTVLIIVTGMLVILVGIVIAVANNNIATANTAFTQGYILNDQVKIQRAILLLQIETNKLIDDDDTINFESLDRERALLESQLRLAIAEVGGNTPAAQVFANIQRSLVDYDAILINLKSSRTPDSIKSAIPELDAILSDIEDQLKSLYNQEEVRFFNNIGATLVTQDTYQTILLVMSLLLAVFSVALVLSFRNSVNVEFARAYRLLLDEYQERRRIEQNLRRQNSYLEALHETTLGLLARRELDKLLESLVTRAGELTDAPYGFLYMGDEGKGEIELKVRVGFTGEQASNSFKEGEGLAGKVWQSGKSIIVDDYSSWAGRSPKVAQDSAKAVVAVPLNRSAHPHSSETKPVGVLGLAHSIDSEQIFGQEEIELLTRFAQLASVAIDNALLFEEAERARASAEKANEAKSAFLANMSHELRTPLNAIIGFTRIVKRKGVDSLPEKQLNNLEKVLVSADHLLVLINTILDIAKIEAGHMDVQPITFDIAKLIEVCTVTTRPMLAHGVEINNDISEEISPIYSDQDKVKQILLNLLSNAAKFTLTGTITVQAHQSTEVLSVRVIDTGIGISKEDLHQIFEEFKQVNNGNISQYGGTGLGLSISRQLARLLGGDVAVESKLNEGSTFRLTLPIRYSQISWDIVSRRLIEPVVE